jgi:hypothetical protein
MHTMLPCRVLKPSLSVSLVPPAAVLLLIARAGKVLDIWASSRNLQLGTQRKES